MITNIVIKIVMTTNLILWSMCMYLSIEDEFDKFSFITFSVLILANVLGLIIA